MHVECSKFWCCQSPWIWYFRSSLNLEILTMSFYFVSPKGLSCQAIELVLTLIHHCRTHWTIQRLWLLIHALIFNRNRFWDAGNATMDSLGLPTWWLYDAEALTCWQLEWCFHTLADHLPDLFEMCYSCQTTHWPSLASAFNQYISYFPARTF